jgi:predicted nucleic acid-binding Zn ribbon protein
VRSLRADVEPATLLAAVQGVWPDAVGERVAAEARPVRERERTVVVECRSATWAQELDLLHDELLGRVNDALGDDRVGRLRLIVGETFSSDSL